jgi:hypothetical protein
MFNIRNGKEENIISSYRQTQPIHVLIKACLCYLNNLYNRTYKTYNKMSEKEANIIVVAKSLIKVITKMDKEMKGKRL